MRVCVYPPCSAAPPQAIAAEREYLVALFQGEDDGTHQRAAMSPATTTTSTPSTTLAFGGDGDGDGDNDAVPVGGGVAANCALVPLMLHRVFEGVARPLRCDLKISFLLPLMR